MIIISKNGYNKNLFCARIWWYKYINYRKYRFKKVNLLKVNLDKIIVKNYFLFFGKIFYTIKKPFNLQIKLIQHNIPK